MSPLVMDASLIVLTLSSGRGDAGSCAPMEERAGVPAWSRSSVVQMGTKEYITQHNMYDLVYRLTYGVF